MHKELESNFFCLVKSDKDKAFQLVFDAYWNVIYRQAFKKTQDKDIAKDLAQDIFVCLWDKIEFLDSESSVLSYLFAILRNKALKLYERDHVRLRYANHLAINGSVKDDYSQNILLEKELKNIIDDEVSKMPPRMKQIYILKKEDELSIREIAAELSISEQTIKNQLQTAYQRLRVRVGDYDSSLAVMAIVIAKYMS